MTIRHARENHGRRAARLIAAGCVTAFLLILTFAYLHASSAIAVVEARTVVRSRPSPSQMELTRYAVAARPLRQVLLYVATVDGQHTTDRQWIDVLNSLGWRSTHALQLILAREAAQQDLAGMLDIFDALLRRGRLFSESAAAIRLMEGEPDGRPHVVRLLVRRPPWRRDYLVMANELPNSRTVLGRYQVLNALQDRGDRLTRDEIAPLLPALIRFGHAAEAWQLWQRFAGARAVSSPLQDTNFRIVANSSGRGDMSVPFEWRIMTGAGFSVEPYMEGSKALLGISWDGRGAPIFAAQRTSAQPGRFRLDLGTADHPDSVNKLLTFRLRCDDGTVSEFVSTGQSSAGLISYETKEAVRCGLPELEVAGRAQGSASSHSIALERIALRPLLTPNRRVASVAGRAAVPVDSTKVL